MTNALESETSNTKETIAQGGESDPATRGWLKVGTVAAVSAVVGGLAAAWFYRKTLSRLREAEDQIPDPKSGLTGDATGEDF